MNLNFTDIGTSLINMAQQDIPGEVMQDLANSGTRNPAFADKLDKTLKSVESPKKDTPDIPVKEKSHSVQKEVSETVSETVSEKIPEKISDKLDQKKGHGFVSELKTIFLSLSKGNLKDISIDPEGLETLKKMLLKAGFGENEIDDIMSELSDKLNDGALTLDEVFDHLFKLPFEMEDVLVEEPALEAEQVPFIESILVSLGISQKTVQEILSEADRGDRGISLDVVIEKLQSLQKKAFHAQQPYQVPKTDETIQMLSRQIGLNLDNTNADVFSLNDVVRSLENLRQNKEELQNLTTDQANHAGDEKSVDLLNALFKTLKIKDDGSKTRMAGFSTDKIKENVETPILVSRDEVGEKNLFNLGKGEKSLKNSDLKSAFKEVENLADPKAKESLAAKEQPTDAKIGVRKLMVAGERNIDQSQVAVSDSKPGETEQKNDIFKNRMPVPKPLPAYVTQQVSKSLVRAVNQGESSLKIQLKPPELGRMLLTIQNSGNSLRVSIMTENHSAKEIIAQNVTELRTMLSNSGVTLERFEVDMSSDFRQSMADAHQQTGHSGKRNKNQSNKAADAGSGEGIDQGISELNGLDRNGSVHLVA